jgi:hypothetical protein
MALKPLAQPRFLPIQEFPALRLAVNAPTARLNK